MKFIGKDGPIRFEGFSFGSIRTNGATYEHDVVIDRGRISKRRKKSSKIIPRHLWTHTARWDRCGACARVLMPAAGRLKFPERRLGEHKKRYYPLRYGRNRARRPFAVSLKRLLGKGIFCVRRHGCYWRRENSRSGSAAANNLSLPGKR